MHACLATRWVATLHASVCSFLILACKHLMRLGTLKWDGDEPFKLEKQKNWDKPYKPERREYEQIIANTIRPINCRVSQSIHFTKTMCYKICFSWTCPATITKRFIRFAMINVWTRTCPWQLQNVPTNAKPKLQIVSIILRTWFHCRSKCISEKKHRWKINVYTRSKCISERENSSSLQSNVQKWKRNRGEGRNMWTQHIDLEDELETLVVDEQHDEGAAGHHASSSVHTSRRQTPRRSRRRRFMSSTSSRAAAVEQPKVRHRVGG